ncbi:MAG: phosphoglucosamine mutase [Limnochordia bacterium]|nr:phosphoglucosamine mutase [Limnochordia bacterium]
MLKFFGTDGIRGVANRELTAELALRVGRAASLVLGNELRQPVLIGRDPRLSGQMLEGALIAGITSAGLDVILVGVVPTPAVAFLTKELGCSAGIMISASHNPLEDNGIKVFGSDGFKLSEELEEQIEACIEEDQIPRPIGGDVGQVVAKPSAVELYVQNLKEQVAVDLQGLRLAIDCANGATSGIAARVFRDLGADVTSFYDMPNGININHLCGSTFPEKIQSLTREADADLGFAFDGDGDRILAVDERGGLLNGDQILAIIGLQLLRQNRLPGQKVIATAYSNGGLRQAFVDQGGDVIYSKPGDRFVLESMQSSGCILGGEQSGHIIFLENSTTGDGILSALKLLEMRQIQDQTLASLAEAMVVFPQSLVNIPVTQKEGWQENQRIQGVISQAERDLGPLGRLFVRASGTEPMIRVLGEHPDAKILDSCLRLVVQTIQEEQGGSRVG